MLKSLCRGRVTTCVGFSRDVPGRMQVWGNGERATDGRETSHQQTLPSFGLRALYTADVSVDCISRSSGPVRLTPRYTKVDIHCTGWRKINRTIYVCYPRSVSLQQDT